MYGLDVSQMGFTYVFMVINWRKLKLNQANTNNACDSYATVVNNY